MKLKITVMCCLQIFIIIILIFFGPYIFSCSSDRGVWYYKWDEIQGIHTTTTFNTLVFMQVFDALISRNLDLDMNIFKNLTKNKIFIIIQTFIVIAQLLIIEFGFSMTRAKPLSLFNNLLSIAVASLTLLSVPIVKLISLKINMQEVFEKDTDMFYKMNNGDETDKKKVDTINKIEDEANQILLSNKK